MVCWVCVCGLYLSYIKVNGVSLLKSVMISNAGGEHRQWSYWRKITKPPKQLHIKTDSEMENEQGSLAFPRFLLLELVVEAGTLLPFLIEKKKSSPLDLVKVGKENDKQRHCWRYTFQNIQIKKISSLNTRA